MAADNPLDFSPESTSESHSDRELNISGISHRNRENLDVQTSNFRAIRRLFSDRSCHRVPLDLRDTSSSLLLDSSSQSDTLKLILEELKKNNARLDSFSENLKSLDGRLESVEQSQAQLSNSSTPSSSGTDGSAVKSGKRKVPAKVAVREKVLEMMVVLPVSK